MGNIAEVKIGIIQELFINSYETRLLHNGVDLLNLKQYKTLDTQIENDLMIVKAALEASDLKDNVLRLSLAVFFFYKFSHKLLSFNRQNNLLFVSTKQKIYIEFLLLFKDFYLFMLIFDSAFKIYDDNERMAVGKQYEEELQNLYQKFFTKYRLFGIIKNLYSTQLTQWSQLPREIISDINGIDYEPLINQYMTHINSIDSKLFYSIIDSFKEIYSNGFIDKYGELKQLILDSVDLRPTDKKAIIRDYEVNAVVKKEHKTDIYKIILLDFETMGIYSNADMLAVYELTGNTQILNSVIFVLDQFFTLYYLVCFGSNGNAGNFKYYINAFERKENINYSTVLEEHFLAQLKKREATIIAQMNELLEKMPSSDLFSFFKTIEMKINFNLRDIFYAPNKTMIDSAGQYGGYDLSKLTFGESEFLTDSIKTLLKNMYDKLKLKEETKG
jgi:hypothetical protein